MFIYRPSLAGYCYQRPSWQKSLRFRPAFTHTCSASGTNLLSEWLQGPRGSVACFGFSVYVGPPWQLSAGPTVGSFPTCAGMGMS